MKALGSFVVVRPISEKIESKGVILSAQTEKNVRYLPGEVITCGNEVKMLSQGDKIYYDKMAASDIRVGEDKYVVLLENGCVVKK